MSWKKIVLKNPIIHRRHDGETIKCHGQNCDAQLKAGDECWSHINRAHGTHYYCLECYEHLWL